MKFAVQHKRASVLQDGFLFDVQRESEGSFSSDPMKLFATWEQFRAWAAQHTWQRGEQLDEALLDAPVPLPRQVFAVALNYPKHADEGKVDLKETDFLVFTKFPSCIAGPNASVRLPSAYVDWEVELTAVIGKEAFQIKEEEAWSHVAGLMIGQDLSEREIQLSGAKPQFSLGKSFPGFGPTGPYLVTPDEFTDPDDLGIICRNKTEVLQDSRTSEMIYSVSAIISERSEERRVGKECRSRWSPYH